MVEAISPNCRCLCERHHSTGRGDPSGRPYNGSAGRVNADDIAVEMSGGTLRVGFSLANGASTAEEIHDFTLEGPAEVVYLGTLEV